MNTSERSWLGIPQLILITAFIRCLLACTIHLGNDEAYYFTYALLPDYNYFDHPPLIAYCIRIATLNLVWVNDFTMRLTAIISGAVAAAVMARCTKLLTSNPVAPFITVVLYQCVIYTSIISGLFILPDAPQMVFWSLSLYYIIRIATDTHLKPLHFIWLGVFAGLTIMCKIHGVFLWIGFGVYILCYQRVLLRYWQLYAAILITAIITLPILIWNIQNNFVTWNFHSNRVTVNSPAIHVDAFIQAVFGQLLYNNPFYIILLCLAIYHHKRMVSKKSAAVIFCLSLPIIIATTAISLFRNVLPHWSGPGFMSFIPLVAAFVGYKQTSGNGKLKKRLYKTCIITVVVIAIAAPLVINFYPGTPGDRQTEALGKGDVTLDMYGWNGVRKLVQQQREKDIASGMMKADDPLIVDKWFPAAQYLFYVTRKMDMRIVGVGDINDLHQFAWLNAKYGRVLKGQNAYYVDVSNYNQDPVRLYGGYFERVEKVKVCTQMRGSKPARYIRIYRCIHAKADLGEMVQ